MSSLLSSKSQTSSITSTSTSKPVVHIHIPGSGINRSQPPDPGIKPCPVPSTPQNPHNRVSTFLINFMGRYSAADLTSFLTDALVDSSCTRRIAVNGAESCGANPWDQALKRDIEESHVQRNMQRADEKDASLQQPPLAPPPPKQPQAQASAATQPQQPKALRFVTNSGAPQPKRRRIGAACQTCRRRKTACSGERPSCETCRQNKVQCLGYNAEFAAAPTNKRTLSDAETVGNSASQSSRSVAHERKKSYSPPRDDAVRKWNPVHPAGTSSGGASPAFTTESQPQPHERDSKRDSLFSGPRNRMPYFRWLGPTAIMPGFKQMVVKVKRQDADVAHSSTDGGSIRSPPLPNTLGPDRSAASIYSTTPAVEPDARTPLNLPFYDTSPMPPSELITHLANTFFSHLGCNYPFLQRRRFLRDLEEKQVDAILVDAVCALAARFSTHSLLTQAAHDGDNRASPAEYGHAFAQRAKLALVDTFPLPSVAAAQAALLLAYNEFGEQRDSGLWMYLGISIRLAQDLGLHKLEGLQYVGRDGPTPKMVKRQGQSGAIFHSGTKIDRESLAKSSQGYSEHTPEQRREIEETRAVEQERVDTFWAIFFLDRVVSSGTGRRGTLRDAEIEICFPSLSGAHNNSDWPAPFPALIRIVHLYGRVADLLNSIKEASDVTTETPKRLATMESQVTNFYQGLSPRLHFDAVSFQHYMKNGEGTNFVLLHFWFHMLIVLLHQPTLLKTFEGNMLQLFPNSQQLSMSSAKTIADILSYSQLMDAKASLGNPFTTQPIYIAACAFLKETAEQTATSTAHSRASSPNRSKDTASDTTPTSGTPSEAGKFSSSAYSKAESPSTRPPRTEPKSQLAKHTLLATAASQHYQLCYKALQSLETYWAGTKYILTILDQKFQGVEDPLLYTTEEGESSMEQPRPEPSFTSPGWRRKLSWGQHTANAPDPMQSPFWKSKAPGSPGGVDPTKAIGWTLTGTMNSPSTNLAWHYASGNGQNPGVHPRLTSLKPTKHDSITGQVPNVIQRNDSNSSQNTVQDNAVDPSQRFTSSEMVVAGPDVEIPVSLEQSFSQQGSGHSPAGLLGATYQQTHSMNPQIQSGITAAVSGSMPPPYTTSSAFLGGQNGQLPMNFLDGDMMIESQDVDMSMLGLDMMPWFDSYPTHDLISSYPYDPTHHAAGGADGSGNVGES